MKINRRLKEGVIGGLVGFLGPTIGFFIYYIFFGPYVNSLTIIPFTTIGSAVTLIIIIIFKKLNLIK